MNFWRISLSEFPIRLFAIMTAFVFTSCSQNDHKNEKSEPIIKQSKLEFAYQQYMENPSVQTLNDLFDYSHQHYNAKFKTIHCFSVYYDWSLPVDPLKPLQELESASEFLRQNPSIMNDTLSEIYRVDPARRVVVVAMLGYNGDARSLRLLREWLLTEENKRVKDRIKRSIDQLMAEKGPPT